MNGGYEYRETIPRQAAGRIVLDWLAERHAHSSAETWRERIAAGQVALDGRTVEATDVLRPGHSLAWHRPPWDEPAVPLGFGLLHRDAHLLCVAKPRGLPTLPNGGFLEHTLLFLVRRLFPEAVPLHRLGRGTSGLVLFARSAAARRIVAAAWRDGGVEKEYRALVVGQPARESFSVDVPIGPSAHARLPFVHAAREDGRPALSHVRVLETRDDSALVAVTIPTGRPHQIRIHLAAAGHPLVGDRLYAKGGVPGAQPALPGEGGYWLHAWRLAFTHPQSGLRVELTCPPPPPLRTPTERGPVVSAP